MYSLNNDDKYNLKNISSLKSQIIVWIIPIIVLIIIAYTLFRSYEDNKLNISFILNDATDIKIGTSVKYRGIIVARVQDISYDFKNHKILAVAKVTDKKTYNYVARSINKFYVQKFKATLAGISNINSILKGASIILYSNIKNKKEVVNSPIKKIFIIDSSRDVVSEDLNKFFIVHIYGDNINDVEIGNVISYRGVEIGHIVNKIYKDEDVYVKAVINRRYTSLFKKNIYFYKRRLLKVSADQSGINFKVNNVSTLNKTIGVGVSNYKSNDKKNRYYLHDSKNFINSSVLKIKLNTPSMVSLVANKTFIKYKGITIGKIGKSKYLSNKNMFLIDAYIYKKYKNLIRNDTKFHIAKPVISLLNGVKNLDTLVLGTYIALQKGNSSKFSTNFYMYNGKYIKKGIKFNLITDNLRGVKIGSPINYRGVLIGEINSYKLSKDKIVLNSTIYNPYAKFIDSRSKFYLGSLVSLKYDFSSGLNLDLNSDNLGHINIDILPYKGDKIDKIKSGSNYKLFENIDIAKDDGYTIYLTSKVVMASLGSPIKFKNFVIGKVTDIKFDKNYKVIYTIKILTEYKGLILKSTEFYSDSDIKVDFGLFSGLKVSFSSMKDVLLGGINIKQKQNGDQTALPYKSTVPLYTSHSKVKGKR